MPRGLISILGMVAVASRVVLGGQLWADVCTQDSIKSMRFCDASADVDSRAADYVSRLPDNLKGNLMSNGAGPVPSLSIPPYQWGSEGLHGPLQPCVTDNNSNVTKCPTSFPAASATATSYNDTLFRMIGDAIGIEARAINNLRNHVTQNQYGDGLDYWSPTVNMQRDPRWGRNQEVPGEDPTLSSRYAENYIHGIQGGEDANHVKIIATCKHFIANSLENWNGHTRHNFDAQVPKSDLADYYSVAFNACVTQGKALGIMCSYNAVNGVPMCANTKWLNDTLRNSWGFDGYVTSDCGAILNIFDGHSYTPNGSTAAAAGIIAGTDVDCGGVYDKSLADALRLGEVSMSVVDQALRRLTKMQMKLGLFDEKSNQPYFNYGIEKIDNEDHQQLALEAAKQAIVLLKNDGKILPLTAGKSIAVIGPHVNSTQDLISNYHGSRCVGGKSDFSCIQTPLAAISEANKGGKTVGVAGVSIAGMDASNIPEAVMAAKSADVVILTVGIDQSQEREGLDRVITTLPGLQTNLTEAILAVGKPTVVVLIHGGTMSLGSLKDTSPAIVDAFYGGEKASAALASVLFGETNPSGRMAATMYPPSYVDEIPLTQMAMTVPPGRTHLYYTGTPEFKFGDGLSYSEFITTVDTTSTVTTIQTEDTARTVVYNANVSLAKGPSGKHTVLAFWRPAGTTDLGRPLRQKMFDYDSVILNPGETGTLHFELQVSSLAVADDSGNMFVYAGDYEIFFYDGVEEVAIVPFKVTGNKQLTQLAQF